MSINSSINNICNIQAGCQVTLDSIFESVVLVRTAFDIPNLRNTARLKDAFPTIFQLLNQKNKLILASKWGKVETRDPMWSMQKQAIVLEKLLNKEMNKIYNFLDKSEENKSQSKVIDENLLAIFKTEGINLKNKKIKVTFIDQFLQPENILEQVASFKAKSQKNTAELEIILLENTHFEPAEKSKDSNLRKEIALKYAKFTDYLVDEAFPSCHRKEATNTELKELLPFAFGLSYQKEMENLNKLKNNPAKPLVILMGGAKLETKLPLIIKMLDKADKIILAGMLAFTFLAAREDSESKSFTFDQNLLELSFLDQAKIIYQNYKHKLVLPVDFAYDQDRHPKDIGQETIALFKRELEQAKSIFWNGPLGKFEEKPFDQGTLAIVEFISQLDCFKVLGGGDTLSAIPAKFLKKFDFISMGGGATLDFLAK